MNKDFRYKISYQGGFRYMDPLNANGTKIKTEKEGENVFFRSKLSGSLKFIKEDFGVLLSLELSGGRCTELLLDVDRFCGGAYVPFWKGTFSLNEVKWNLSKCEAQVQARPNDAYRKVIDYYSKEFNVLELPATDTVAAKLDLDQQFAFLSLPNAEEVGNYEHSDTWALFLQMNYWIDGNLTHKGKYNTTAIFFRTTTTRPFINGAPPELSGWTIIDENQDTQVATYAKKPDIYNFQPYRYDSKAAFNHYQDLYQIPCGGDYDEENWLLIPDCLNIRKKITEDRNMQIVWRFGSFQFNRNRKLLDVVKFLLSKTAPEVEPAAASEISEFFTLDTNYATGETNKVKNILIAQKSDIISSNSSEAAKKGMISLKNLLDDLRAIFQVYWFLDAEGKFRLEHISYFEDLETVDFTEEKYKHNLEGKLAYEYETSKMPRFEKLIFSDAENEDFREGIIEYVSSCVNYQEGQDKKETTISRISTDIENLIISGNSGSREGFVLISHDNAGKVLKEIGDISGTETINAHLSAANVMRNYWLHNRVLFSGIMNGKVTEFLSVVKTKKQVPFTVPLNCELEINPFFTYITNLGNKGSLFSSEIDFKSNSITLEIIHETTGSGIADLLRQFDDSFDLSFL